MWSWALNWGIIRDDLVIGSCPRSAADLDAIGRRAGATAVLSLQTDDCREAVGVDQPALAARARRLGLALANAPMRDFDVEDQRRHLPSAVTALCRLLEAGSRGRVYVHCTAGINRAPLTVLAYLTLVEGLTATAAQALILRGRPEAEPYWDAYRGCLDDLLARHARPIQQRLDALLGREPHPPRRPPEALRLQAEQEILRLVLAGQDVP